MTKQLLVITIISTFLFISCTNSAKNKPTELSTTKANENTLDTITTTTIDDDGNELTIVFNNSEKTADVEFNGENIHLDAMQSASGFWYRNDNYELRGKGNNVELKKNDEVLFSYEDDIVSIELTSNDGNTLNITFNNSEGTAKAYLNGGAQIDLVAERAASGIWYTNEYYELRGKGEKLELTRNGDIVFKN